MANPVLAQLVDAAITIQAAAAIAIGDLVGLNTSGEWVKADATTPSMYAQFVAIEDGVRADAIYNVRVTKRAYFSDEDFPYTAAARQYLSETAGAHTATRPTTDGAVIQIVGRAVSTSVIYVDIKSPTLVNVYVARDQLDTSGEPGLGAADTGWAGASLTGIETARTQPFMVPFNCCTAGALKAKLVFNSINASAGDIDISLVGAYVGGNSATGVANNQVTTAITAKDWEQTDVDNVMLTVDLVAALVITATEFTPGRLFQLYIDPDVLTADGLFLGMWLEFEVC